MADALNGVLSEGEVGEARAAPLCNGRPRGVEAALRPADAEDGDESGEDGDGPPPFDLTRGEGMRCSRAASSQESARSRVSVGFGCFGYDFAQKRNKSRENLDVTEKYSFSKKKTFFFHATARASRRGAGETREAPARAT